VKKIINSADMVLLPSLAEAFPMTWLEAMALEKKLITSDIGWAKELMIDGETGFMVTPKNVEDFSSKILALLDDKGKAKQMAKNARERIINSFEMNTILEENIEIYKKIR